MAKAKLKSICMTLLFAAAPLLLTSPACAQLSDAHDVETLDVSDVGTYRPQQTPELAEVKRRIVDLTNEFREGEDRAAVEVDEQLEKAAQYFADYMARTDRYGHTADGKRPAERAAAHDYEYCIVLENIAYQFRSRGFATAQLAEAFVEGWKNSPGHRKNMLDADATETGVAVAVSEKTGVFYGVQMFGRPKSDAIEFRITNTSSQSVEYRIAERRFTLEPRYSRTHSRCRPGELTLLETSDEGEPSAADRAKPAGGEQFVVVEDDDGKLSLRRKAREGATR